MIYHMLPLSRWASQPPTAAYTTDSLRSEGFIHCTGERAWLLRVANRFYQNEPGEWAALLIDEARVSAEVRWEEADGHRFPHIYGPLNLDAVVDVVQLPRDEAGKFLPPPAWGA